MSVFCVDARFVVEIVERGLVAALIAFVQQEESFHDVNPAKHVGQISVPSGRRLAFKDQYVYISSYAGPLNFDPNARKGYVARVDTAQLGKVDTCVVGYQPEDIVVSGNKLYVANSGGYRAPVYDSTVSVIDLSTFKEIYKST